MLDVAVKSRFIILSKWKVESTWHFSIESTGELLQLKAKLNDKIANMNVYEHLLLKLADNSDTT